MLSAIDSMSERNRKASFKDAEGGIVITLVVGLDPGFPLRHDGTREASARSPRP
jgi:hypothetical protein